MTLSDKLWKWPEGLVWKLTRAKTVDSRRKRFEIFMAQVSPNSQTRVLDVGVGEGEGRAVNFFEDWYPWPENITAVALEDLPHFRASNPKVKFVIADGRALPFADKSFDVYFSNAVIEHVGKFDDQKKFLSEACRAAKKVFIATPYRWFPVDLHTMIPFVHYLPMAARNFVYKRAGRGSYAAEENLRLLDVREIKKMLPLGAKMTVFRQKVLGLTANLNILIEA